ncbi:MAG: rod shape-determining protein MreC, partial [Patescibacteria group bacterium]
MKKTFLVRRNALLSSTGISWGGIALACAVCALVVRLIAPNFFWQTMAPAFRLADTLAATSRTFFAGFGDTAALVARNEQLVRENAALTSENQSLHKKEILTNGFDSAKGILAAVVARPPESPYDTLVLAAGERAGVVLGQEAFGEGEIPLGIVTAVTADFARVTLFSSPGTRTYGWVGLSVQAGSENIPLIISGSGAGTMQASLSRSANITVGDTVFAPGPGMLPIGSVVRIDSDPSSPGMTLRIMPNLNPFSLVWVQLRDVGAEVRNLFSVA